MAVPPVVSFLSDYGTSDEFVGVCKAVMASIAPELRVIDITHEIPPFDIRLGALTLVRAAQYLPEGIVLAIVDPGVATDRRCIAVEVDGGVLIGPDNGLLAPAVAMLGGPTRVVALTNEDYQLAAPSATFAGRDVMAPAAAHLAAGVPITELGDEVDPLSLVPGVLPLPDERDDARLVGEVIWIDRYGNCQLNLDPDQLAPAGFGPGSTLLLEIGEEVRRARWVTAFAQAKARELACITDSYGLLALVVDRGSAQSELSARVGTKVAVVLDPDAAGPSPLGGTQTPVELRRAP